MSNIVIQRIKDEALIKNALDQFDIGRGLDRLAVADYSDQLIEVLIELLHQVRDPIVKLQIVKALCGPYRSAYERVEKVLVDQYLDLANSQHLPCVDSLMWGIGNCLGIITSSTSPHLSTYKSIVEEKNYGASRQMLVIALSKFDKNKVEDTLIRLLDDPEVAGHAVMALGKIKSTKALPKLKKCEISKIAWIKREATKSVRLIET
jgi:hypothetical protein